MDLPGTHTDNGGTTMPGLRNLTRLNEVCENFAIPPETVIDRIGRGVCTYASLTRACGRMGSDWRPLYEDIRWYCTRNGVVMPSSSTAARFPNPRRRPSTYTAPVPARPVRNEGPSYHRGVQLPPSNGSRRFGVEIEFRRPRSGDYCYASQIVDALQAAGLTVREEGYNHDLRPDSWKLTTDASSDLELVSPPLSGQDGMRQVRTAMRTLRSIGCRITSSEGMQVHVDATDLSGDQIADVYEGYVARQDAFNAFLPQSRHSSQWCRRIQSDEANYVAAELRRNRRSVASDRYRTINMAAFPRHGTVEFRQHAGTLNATKALAWVRLLLGFVDARAAGENPGTTPETLVGDLVAAGRLNRGAAEYLEERAGTLA
jgi:hypothetical protein